jgi:hypothetical protein
MVLILVPIIGPVLAAIPLVADFFLGWLPLGIGPAIIALNAAISA